MAGVLRSSNESATRLLTISSSISSMGSKVCGASEAKINKSKNARKRKRGEETNVFKDTIARVLRGERLVPRMLTDIRERVAFFRIDDEHSSDEILDVGLYKGRDRELAALDLCQQVSDVVIVERQLTLFSPRVFCCCELFVCLLLLSLF